MTGDTTAAAIAAAVQRGQGTATARITATLAQIRQTHATANCFTEVLADRALETAQRVDRAIAAGQSVGPLAGVPFAVKKSV